MTSITVSRPPITPRRPTKPQLVYMQSSADLDSMLEGLRHINKNISRRAASDIASLPHDITLPVLIPLLAQQEVAYRRAVVQCLGMIGMQAVSELTHALETTTDITARASAAKALASVALFYPRERQNFPQHSIKAMEHILFHAPDPVTKLALVGCLGTLGSDATEVESDSQLDSPSRSSETQRLPGNDSASHLLARILNTSTDAALCVTAASALAQIANCATSEKRQHIMQILREIAQRPLSSQSSSSNSSNDQSRDNKQAEAEEEEEDDDGFGYVREMCLNHVTQLQGK